MPIKFKCPHCHKPLSVKDHLGGKRAACPACKKVLTIPAPTAPPVDLEDFAASALADEPPPPEATEQPTAIDSTCPFCDEALHLSIELAGKQAPCPACKRIIKVPLPVKQKPQDWRKVETQGPLLARREDEPPPEGAWGTAARPGTVSEEALEEAGALPEEEREPLTLGQKIRRGLLATGGLAVLVVGWFVLRNY